MQTLNDIVTLMGRIIHGVENLLDRNQGMVLWTICTLCLWGLMWKYRERSIKGLEGSNLFWEGSEQVVWWFLWGCWPVFFYSCFIKDIPLYAWLFMAFGLGFAMLGRKIFDYGLAYLGKAPVKDDTQPQLTNKAA